MGSPPLTSPTAPAPGTSSLLTGDLSQLELSDGDGSLYDVANKHRIFLCRCGASITKPFCDGHHSMIGCEAAERAWLPGADAGSGCMSAALIRHPTVSINEAGHPIPEAQHLRHASRWTGMKLTMNAAVARVICCVARRSQRGDVDR